jgi:hypothetical protein
MKNRSLKRWLKNLSITHGLDSGEGLAMDEAALAIEDLENENERLREALINLKGWAVANARTPIYELLAATDAALYPSSKPANTTMSCTAPKEKP